MSSDARRRHIRAYDMLPNGTIAKETSRVFVDLGGPEPGVARRHQGRHAPATSIQRRRAAGSTSSTPRARSSDASSTAQPATTNVAFGGDDWKTLYFTTRSTLYTVNLKVAGVPVPVGKKGT